MDDNLASNIQDTTVSAKELKKTLETISEVTGRSVKNLKEARTAMQDIAKDAERLSDAEEKYHGSLKKALETQKQQDKQLKQNLRQTESLLRDIPKGFSDAFDKSVDGLRAETLRGLEKDFNDMADRMNAKLADGMKLSANDILSMKDKREVLKRIGDLNKAAANLDSRTFGKGALTKMGDAKSLFQSAREGWRDRTGNGTRVAGNVLKEKGALRGGLTGKMMGGLGGGMAAGAKFIPIAGQIIGAISAVNDMINAADRIQKGSRQDYAALAGPQFEGEKFKNRAHSYNTEIRDVRRNQQLGVGYQEWNGMFQAMSNAGMSVTTLDEKVGSLGDIMTSVRKSSLNLGLGLETTGDIFTTQFLEMDSALDSVQKGMLEVAKGSKVAGIETSKFYQSVAQSTLALSSYGNFTAAAAAAQRKLQNNSGTSKQSGAEHGNKILTMFENMSASDLTKLVGTLRNTIGDIKGRLSSYIKQQEASLAKAKSPDEALKIRSNIEAAKAAQLSDVPETAMGIMLQRMPEMASSLVIEYMKTTNHIGNNDDLVARLMGSGALTGNQVVDDAIKKDFRDNIFGYKGEMTEGLGKLNEYSKKIVKSGTDQEKGTYNGMLAIMEKGSEATTPELEKLYDFLENKIGIQGTDLYGLKKLFSKDMITFGKELEKTYKNNKSALQKDSKAALANTSANDIAVNMYDKLAYAGRGAEGAAMQVSGTSDMIAALTPLEKMTQIAKDSYIYQLSDSQAAQVMVGISQGIRDGIWTLVEHFKIAKSDTEEVITYGKQTEAINNYFKDTLDGFTSGKSGAESVIGNLEPLMDAFGVAGEDRVKLKNAAKKKWSNMAATGMSDENKLKAIVNDSDIFGDLGVVKAAGNVGGIGKFPDTYTEKIANGSISGRGAMYAAYMKKANNPKTINVEGGANSNGRVGTINVINNINVAENEASASATQGTSP